MEAQVPESNLIEKAHPTQCLVEHILGDLPLERCQLEVLEPRQETLDRQLGHLGDRASGDADLKSLRLQLGAVTRGTLARGLVLSKEDADVLLVPLLFEIAQERKDPFVAARTPVEQLVALIGAQVAPW